MLLSQYEFLRGTQVDRGLREGARQERRGRGVRIVIYFNGWVKFESKPIQRHPTEGRPYAVPCLPLPASPSPSVRVHVGQRRCAPSPCVIVGRSGLSGHTDGAGEEWRRHLLSPLSLHDDTACPLAPPDHACLTSRRAQAEKIATALRRARGP